MEKKSLFKSKTVITQLVFSGLAALIPGFRDWIGSNPEAYVFASSLVTILMRLLLSNVKMPG